MHARGASDFLRSRVGGERRVVGKLLFRDGKNGGERVASYLGWHWPGLTSFNPAGLA